MPPIRMVPLVTVGNAFSARVLAARLGSEGIVTSLAGAVDGPYPFGDVHVSVDADDLDLARQLLLADEVEAAFVDGEDVAGAGIGRDDGDRDAGAGAGALRLAARHPRLLAGTAVAVAVVSSLARVLTL